MLQYRTRAGVLPKPCNCGFLENQGLQRVSLYVKSRFCLETHVADSQRCRCKALAINRPAMKLSFILLAGTVPPPGFDIVFFATGGSFFIFVYRSSSFYFRDAGCGREDFRSILLCESIVKRLQSMNSTGNLKSWSPIRTGKGADQN